MNMLETQFGAALPAVEETVPPIDSVSVSDESRFDNEKNEGGTGRKINLRKPPSPTALPPVSVSDESRFERERNQKQVRSQEQPKEPAPPGGSGFEIAGFNGYLVLVLVVGLILALTWGE